ncbi:MAG: hypothetical protein FKY71_07080 [Spiribacter salinus]|uniref:Type II secretion system protein GspC N-terminal domain-containing protein n=1 Tax=Spiribacter salinus TaxID=1335746 RepID=A0A540VS47_9GAMM|nr:MAG: hypothetical protein FKY71_07840 [Spiribacter salinus]TQE99726.1 MAG: hypothetical protein FKY71_07080 [Spiribacter salinus]
MIRRLVTDQISWALLAGCLVLAVMLTLQIADAPDPGVTAATPNSQGANAAATAREEPLQFPPLTAYQEIVERPLFSKDRRPPPAPAAETSQASTVDVPQYELEGTVLSPDGSFAILQDRRKRELQRLGLGERLDAWTVAEIGEGWLRLEHGERNARLQMDLPGGPSNPIGPEK